MIDTRAPLKAWAFRGLGLMLVETGTGLEGEIWEGDVLQVVLKIGSATEKAATERLQLRAADLRPLPSIHMAPPSPRQRSFVDRAGRAWQVSEAMSARWNWAQVGDSLRDRALLFDSDDIHCRLSKYPPNWDELPDYELESLIGRAECTWRRRGTTGGGRSREG